MERTEFHHIHVVPEEDGFYYCIAGFTEDGVYEETELIGPYETRDEAWYAGWDCTAVQYAEGYDEWRELYRDRVHDIVSALVTENTGAMITWREWGGFDIVEDDDVRKIAAWLDVAPDRGAAHIALWRVYREARARAEEILRIESEWREPLAGGQWAKVWLGCDGWYFATYSINREGRLEASPASGPHASRSEARARARGKEA